MSCLERCPYFSGVFIEGFQCNTYFPELIFGCILVSCISFYMYITAPDFHGVGDYELSYSLDMSLLSRQATVSVTPSLSSRAHGYMRTSGGGVQYATVTLEGTVLEASLPLTLWHNFLEWPLTARYIIYHQ